MRVLGLVFVMVVAFSGLPVHAQNSTMLPELNEIQVHAVVLDSQSVVVDESHNIRYIAGNTYKDVTPRVFLGNIALENQIVLTDEIMQQYLFFVPLGDNKPGIMHVHLPALLKSSTPQHQQADWLDTAISAI